jgi:hypothetical protein
MSEGEARAVIWGGRLWPRFEGEAVNRIANEAHPDRWRIRQRNTIAAWPTSKRDC